MDKKAAEMQFHWMFVLFAGAMILLIFVTFIVRESRTSEELIQADITSKLDALFISALASTKTSFQLTLPKVDLLFTCQYNPENSVPLFSEWRVKESKFSSSLGSFVLFSPKQITGKDLTTFALDWEVPFKAGNFLYLTSPNIRYSFIYSENKKESSGLAQALSEIIPKTINRRFAFIENAADVSEIKVEGAAPKGILEPGDNIKDVIIALNLGDADAISKSLPEGILKKYANEKDRVSIVAVNGNEHKGSIEFYGFEFKQGRGIQKGEALVLTLINEAEYVGEASLIGTIFAEDSENYNCNVKKACGNLDSILSIYQKEVQELAGKFGTACSDLYGRLYGNNGQLNGGLLNRNSDDCLTYLSDNYEEFEEIDRQLQLNSCPLVY